MEKVKPEVWRIMRDNRQTKIKMILSCKMVREYENGSVQLQDSFFHTKVIENLRATDESQAFDTCNTCFELYTRATCTTHVPRSVRELQGCKLIMKIPFVLLSLRLSLECKSKS